MYHSVCNNSIVIPQCLHQGVPNESFREFTRAWDLGQLAIEVFSMTLTPVRQIEGKTKQNETVKEVVLLTEHTNSSQYMLVILVRDNRRCTALCPIWCAGNAHQDIERLQEWPRHAEVIAEYMKVRHGKASAETGGSQHHLYGPYQLVTQSQ
jgi:hypothetical protein